MNLFRMFTQIAMIVGFSTPVFSQNCNPLTDSLELVVFYNNFNGASWTNNDNWLVPGKSITEWHGVETSSDGCVTQLILSTNNLDGFLYDMDFPSLSALNLSGNNLEGAVVNFSKIPNLTSLNLSKNKLEGFIPTFDSLSLLEELDLGLNRLSGEIPYFANLYNLKTINLTTNYLSGSIDNISYFDFLTTLNLSHNHLSGFLPDSAYLPSLEYLDLTGNKFSGSVPDFFGAPLLRSILLSGNNLEGSIPDFTFLPNLQELQITNNHLSGSIPNFINNPQLTSVWLANNNLDGGIPDLSHLQELSSLWLSNNKLSGTIPEFLIDSLYFLELSGNNLSGPVTSTASDIFLLSTRNNNLTFEGVILDWGGSLPPIYLYYPQKLVFKDTTIIFHRDQNLIIEPQIDYEDGDKYTWFKDNNLILSDNPNDTLGNMYIFDMIDSDAGIYRFQITNQFAPQLTLQSHNIKLILCDQKQDSIQLTEFYQLNNGIGWNNHNNWLVSGSPISTWFGITINNAGCVTEIKLENNNLSGNLTPLSLPLLEVLDLSGNTLSGAIPVMNIPEIIELDLSSNQFQGALPPGITNWHDLEFIDLSYNILSGPIPPDIGDLCELSYFTLNNNLIVGNIPSSVTMLPKLQTGQFDFSGNLLDIESDSLIWFCPFSDLLEQNSQQSGIGNLCSAQCMDDILSVDTTGWLSSILSALECKDSVKSDAGYVYARDVKLLYTRTKRYDTTISVKTDFYDCTGNLIESVYCDENGVCSGLFALTRELFDNLDYQILWNCGQKALQSPEFRINGNIVSQFGGTLGNVLVEMNTSTDNLMDGYSVMTDSTGLFTFDSLIHSSSIVSVEPYKNNDCLNGITTYDLVLITRHILGIKPIDNPYSLIAADANKSGSIATSDILELRKLILGINSEFPNNTSWRFIHKYQNFTDTQNPFINTFRESVTIPFISNDYDYLDFIAVKTGDINGTAVTDARSVPDDRFTDTLFLDISDRLVNRGETFTIEIRASEKAVSYQATLELNGLELHEIPPQMEVDISNFGVFPDAVSFSIDGSDSFLLTFQALKSAKISDLIGLSGRITAKESYSAEETQMHLALRFTDSNDNSQPVVVAPEFKLFGCSPNPWYNSSSITFEVPEPCKVSLKIFDVEGRNILSLQDYFSSGKNYFVLDSKGIIQSGVFYYRLETPAGVRSDIMFKNKSTN
jgi:Leucine-rich repeat (LRR) protein